MAMERKKRVPTPTSELGRQKLAEQTYSGACHRQFKAFKKERLAAARKLITADMEAWLMSPEVVALKAQMAQCQQISTTCAPGSVTVEVP